MVLGCDAAGTIEAVGDGVVGWHVGDRVAAMSFQPIDQNGTYAERMNLGADVLARVPDALSLEPTATLPLAGLTVSQLVGWTDLPAGSTLLVNGPAGAVGRLVVQLAARDGLTVVAVARSDRRDFLLQLGATQVVDRDDFAAAVREMHAGGVDAAVGGSAAYAALNSVRDAGAYITAVPHCIDASGPFLSERDIRLNLHTVHNDPEDLGSLLQSAGRGELTTVIERPYPLARATEAHHRQAQGELHGKLVLLP